MKSHRASPRIRFYYRGEPRTTADDNSSRGLLPALLRTSTLARLSRVHGTDNPIDIQSKTVSRLQRYVPWSSWPEAVVSRRELSFGDRLCLAQHHGLPTLLLDWTLSPLAALYFSVVKYENKDGRVWFMKLKRANRRKRCTCHLEENQELNECAKLPTLVVPKPFSRRIEAQVGRFIYFGRWTQPLESISDTRRFPFQSIGCWIVTSGAKEGIRRELTHLQIHGGTMFPGFDGYARYLAEGGL
jgi:hypothetical protein